MNNIAKKIFELTPWVITSVFILLLPFIWADTTFAGTSLPKILPNTVLFLDAPLLPRQLLLAAYLLVILPFYAIYVFKGNRFKFDRTETIIFGGLALFMIMHVVSCINVINGHEALFHLTKEFMFCLWFFTLYLMMRHNPNGRDWLIKTLTVVSMLFIAIAFIQLAQSDFSRYRAATEHRSYYLNQIMEHVFSTCSNKNLLASLLFITLPTAIYNITNFKRHNIWSAVWLVVGLATALCNLTLIVLLLSRTVFAALALSGLVAVVIIYIYILVINPRQTGKSVSTKTRAILTAAPVVALAAFVAFTTLTETQIEQTVKERINLTINPEKYGYKDNEHGESSVAMRRIIWGKTIEMIKEHPLIGSGPGQWQIKIPKYGVDEFGEKLREGATTFQRPHNDYLWIASEVGIIGLIGYLLFFVGIIAVGFVNIKKANNRSSVIFNTLAISALTGWMLVSLLDYPHERIEHNIVLLAICAIVLTYHEKKDSESETDKRKENIIKISLIALSAAIAIIGFSQTLQFCNGEQNARKLTGLYYKQGWKKIIQLTRKADSQPYTINNYSAPILYYRGFALAMSGDDQAAIVELEKALEFAPYHILTINACGTVYTRLRKIDEAKKMFERTLSLSSHNHNALFDMAIMCYNQKDFRQAFDYISKIPFNIDNKPANFDQAYLAMCRQVVNMDRKIYNPANFSAWMNDEKRIIATVKKFQSDTCSFSKIMMDELGPAN